MKTSYSIGEFSQVTGLSVKTLRFYHEKGILVPSSVDETTGYGEYREDDANFEPCFPIRKEVAVEGIAIRTLPGGRCLTLIHRGPYDQLGRSYAKGLQQVVERKLTVELPTREVYVKGPGMIIKGNPKNYLTEIQLPIGK